MRIVTWNCQQALYKKADALFALQPDIATVQECSEADAGMQESRGYSGLWFGSNPHKGLAVFCRNDWKIRALHEPDHKWIVPLTVESPRPFTFVAVWACSVEASRCGSYIGQVYGALVAHPEWFEGNSVIIAGDFNSNKIWDSSRKVGNHSDVVEMLRVRGLVSAYHDFRGEEQGAETCSTLHMSRNPHRPYHIDYVFLPKRWNLKSAVVGKYDEWSKLSDHCPVIVEVDC